MVARPGRMQSAFVAGELSPLLYERTELKYFNTGLSYAENVAIAPQGGFRNRDGLRDIGALQADAGRLFPFSGSDGVSFDLVFRPAEFEVWSATAKLTTTAMALLTSGMLPEFSVAQQLDTMLCFHHDLVSQRIKHTNTGWAVDDLPYENLPTYDYGADIHGNPYTNGVAAVWQTQFVGMTDGSTVFTLTVSNIESLSIIYHSNTVTLAADIQAALLAMPNIAAGLTAVDHGGGGAKVDITFAGTGNAGDGWAVTGRVINKTDAAVLSFKSTPGVAAGEPVISADRGWPICGLFFNQRLLIGGFKALPNAWMFGVEGDYYNYDIRFKQANGPALVPMDVAGGEGIERLRQNRNLLILTSKAEYFIDSTGLSATSAPNHVQSSTHGTKRGVPVISSEGAALFIHKEGSVLGQLKYEYTAGNFVATDLSLLASHLVVDVVDIAVKRAEQSSDGHLLSMVLADGEARQATLLREQDVTAFTRLTSGAGSFKAVAVNGRNEISWLVARPEGRRLERGETGLLLDEAVSFVYSPAQKAITGLSRFVGRSVWCIADDNVFGPFTVAVDTITLPIAVLTATVGTWAPPIVTTLSPSRLVGNNTVVKRKGRIHSVELSVLDTTSIAVAGADGRFFDVDLVKWGAPADVPELEAPFSGLLKIRGLTGFSDEPTVTISQLRPGRINVRSITTEATF